MNHAPWWATAVRAGRWKKAIVPGLVLLTLAGCNHRRQSMRPVYVAPPAAVDCAPGTDCAPGSSTITAEPGMSESGISSTPDAGQLIPAPSKSRIDSPPASSVPDEPGLSPTSKSKSNSNKGSGSIKSNSNEIELTVPSGASYNDRSKRSSRQTGASRARSASLQGLLRPFVVEPGDLFQPPKADRPWKYVVVHHSAHNEGGLDQIDREHRQVLGWEGCGYHFVIGNGTGSPDGQIEIAQRWLDQKQGAHCRDGKFSDLNEYGIGICLVGDFDDSEPTPKQLEAAKALVAYLSDRYDIRSDRMGTHAQLSNSNTSCPGKNLQPSAIFGTKPVASR